MLEIDIPFRLILYWKRLSLDIFRNSIIIISSQGAYPSVTMGASSVNAASTQNIQLMGAERLELSRLSGHQIDSLACLPISARRQAMRRRVTESNRIAGATMRFKDALHRQVNSLSAPLILPDIVDGAKGYAIFSG